MCMLNITINHYFRCETNITQILRIADKQKLFECDFPDCFRFYESLDKLNLHRYMVHNQQIVSDPNFMKQDVGMMNQMNAQRMPMNYTPNMMPMQGMVNPNFMNPMFSQNP